MTSETKRLRWQPRVPRHKLRRLYETYAGGIVDQDLIDDVGYGIYTRCLHIVEVSEAVNGRVACRNCGHVILRRGGKEQVLKCEKCSWQVLWGDYAKSYFKKRLYWGGAEEFFRDFIKDWPAARTPHDKMQAIDFIIHQVHEQLNVDSRPVAVNLISGKVSEVRALLDELAGAESG